MTSPPLKLKTEKLENMGSRVKNRENKSIETVNEVYSKRHPGLRSEI